ncbi:MAG: 4'-phosphopantetheinyl transferase family protein [Spirulinaceae cyanobacterium]
MMRQLQANDVHLWTGQFQPGRDLPHWPLLNAAEQQRAQRFVRDCDRCRYIWARGNLRRLLGGYLGLAPEAIEFSYGDRGKPYLAQHPVQFNLSHSGDGLIYAFSRDRPIGVDIEQLQRAKDWLPLARRFFCGTEASAIAAVPAAEQAIAFFKLWTRKEAYLKATGEGLQGLAKIEIALDATAQVVEKGWEAWQILDLNHIPGYAGAVAWQLPSPNPVDPPDDGGAVCQPAPTSGSVLGVADPQAGSAPAYESSNLTHFSLPA